MGTGEKIEGINRLFLTENNDLNQFQSIYKILLSKPAVKDSCPVVVHDFSQFSLYIHLLE